MDLEGPQRAADMAKKATANARAFTDGWRDARRLTATAPEGAPPPQGRLEAYFDSIDDGPGVWKWRHYFPIYERHLAKFVGTDFILVEVGIFSGGSLPMWRHYFGPGCRIIGVDIEDACKAYASDGIEVVIGDQSDPAFWQKFRADHPHVDVLIDDGGHEAHQQQVTLREILGHLRPGGVYLCEDIHDAAQPFHAYVEGLTRPIHKMGAVTPIQQHVQSVHTYPYVTVIEKPAHTVAAFEAPRHGTNWEPWL